MKAKYEKPMIIIEKFVLAQTIAKDCSDQFINQVTLNDIDRCGWDVGGGTTVFADGVCTIPGDPDGIVCYNNPPPDSQIFNS